MSDHQRKGGLFGSGEARPSVRSFLRDPESEEVVRHALDQLGVHDVGFSTGDVEKAIGVLAQDASPKLLIVDVSGFEDPIHQINKLAEVCEHGTAVIVIGDRNDVKFYRDLQQAGVAEYFVKPLPGDLVMQVCRWILTGNSEFERNRANMIAVFVGVRGGVGTTTAAISTAWHLAEVEKRTVMLLDLDLKRGDMALQLDATPNHGLREALERPERLDDQFFERAIIRVSSRIGLLASLEPLNAQIGFEANAVQLLVDHLLARYQYIVVDVPVEVATQILTAIRAPNTWVVVSNGTLLSAREVARWRALIGAVNPECKMLHVLNNHQFPGSLPDAEFNRAAGHAPDCVIPYDRGIAEAAMLGMKERQSTSLRRELGPLFRVLYGGRAEVPKSILGRIFT